MSALVGSACATPQGTSATLAAPASHIASAAPNIEPAFALGSFTKVQTAEIGFPATEKPLTLGLPDSTRADDNGHIDPDVLERTIKGHLPTIRACYEHVSRLDPRLAGRVTVAFVVHPDGQVRDAEATENSTGSKAVAECVSRVLRRMRFVPDPTRKSVRCAYPFLFGARN